jgi:galactokinase
MLDVNAIRDQFERHYGIHPRLIVRAPGRVNLIGEHTDYNDGFVLPVAIDRATYVAARPRDDDRVHMVAADMGDEDEFALSAGIERSSAHLWSNYIRGIAKGLLIADHMLRGANILIASDVPRGAGLSSSAALEVAVGYAFQLLNKLNILGEELALLAQGAENSFVGVNSGIMDQFISVLGRANHALLLDCRDLSYRLIPIPPTAAIVVCDSHVERALAASGYNQRRTECEEAVRLFKQWYPKITALRDITLEQFRLHEADLPEPVRARARHVVSENDRAVRGAAALEHGDVATFGALMDESHRSLRDDYEVSCAELDTMVAIVSSLRGVYGARMTGGGFGGCIVALTQPRSVEPLTAHLSSVYADRFNKTPMIFPTMAAAGVTVLE